MAFLKLLITFWPPKPQNDPPGLEGLFVFSKQIWCQSVQPRGRFSWLLHFWPLIVLAYIHSPINPHMCAKIGANRSSHLADFQTFSDPLKPPNSPLCDTGEIFILPTTFSRWICMCVPNLVPIGPQTATCVRLEGYTHTRTHSLLYRYRCVGLLVLLLMPDRFQTNG